jgi:hypothetical protein
MSSKDFIIVEFLFEEPSRAIAAHGGVLDSSACNLAAVGILWYSLAADSRKFCEAPKETIKCGLRVPVNIMRYLKTVTSA